MPRLWKRNSQEAYEAKLDAERQTFLATTPLTLHSHGTIEPPGPGLELISASLCPDLALIALWTTAYDAQAALSSEVIENGVRVTRGRAAWPYRAIVTWHGGPDPTGREPIWIDDLDLARPIVQPMPDGGLLVVSSRCRLRDGRPEHNASMYGSHGFVERSGTVGDGVEDVQVSASGRIWISYFDEGVAGSMGWGDRPELAPIGDAGLVEFSAMLSPIWHFAPPRGLGVIADCYTLNVVDDTVWCSYFPDFPLVRIDSALGVSGWQNDLRGITGVIGSGRRCGLVGGYPPYGDRLAIAAVHGEKLEIERMYRLVLPGGAELPENAQLRCRNERLIALVGLDVFGIDMSALA